ncbi:MAG: choice-of-anchor D domain-containing protein, partial [Candidatus Kapaibacterium sp.]
QTNSRGNDFKSTTVDGVEDLFILKLLASGNIDWVKSYGELGSEYANAIIQLEDDNYVIVGGKDSINNFRGLFGKDGQNAYILKLDTYGDTLWTKQFKGNDNDVAYSVVQSSEGGIIVVGQTSSENNIFDDGNFDSDGKRTMNDGWIFKLDENGDLQWSKTIGGIGEDGFKKIIKSNDGGYIACGFSGSNDRDLLGVGNKGKLDAFIVKLDNSGNTLWTKTFGGSKNEVALDIVHLAEGGYMISGYSESMDRDLVNSYQMGAKDAWVFKINYEGDILWSKLLGGTEFDEATSIIQTYDRKIIVSGTSNSNDGYLKGSTINGQVDAWIFTFLNPLEIFQSDTSDAVFSIIMPEPVIQNNDIDMGQMIVGSTKDTIVSSVICNTGDAALHVLGVDITDTFNSEDFLIPRGAGDFYLEKDECQDMMFEFTPSALGNRTAVATIRTTIGDFRDTIHILGVGINPIIEATAEVVDFGVFELGEGKDTTVILVKNVGSTDINITDTRISGPDMEQFTLSTSPINYTIAAGEEKEFQ